MSNKIELINALFNKISYYEEKIASFRAKEFGENFLGLLALFEVKQDKIEDYHEVDRILSRRIRELDINRSDFRKLSLHLLTMYYKFSANVPHPMDRSYILCKEKRRPRKDDQYLNEVLVPLVFRSGNLNDDYQLKYFFLKRIAAFQNKFGTEPLLPDTLSMDEIKMIPKPFLLLGLMRRNLLRGNLFQGGGTIENKCSLEGYCDNLIREDNFYQYVLQELGYEAIPWHVRTWRQIKRSVLSIFSVFSSLNFFIYVLTRRKLAYLFYFLLILIFLAVCILVPLWWKHSNQKRLQELKQTNASEEVNSNFKFQEVNHKDIWIC